MRFYYLFVLAEEAIQNWLFFYIYIYNLYMAILTNGTWYIIVFNETW